MKVGITGISSTLAICLVGMLVADSNVEKIIGLDVKLYDGPGDEKIVFRKGDVRNADAVRELLRGVDVLFHMAFVVKHGVPDLRDEILDINVNGSKNVFLQAAASGIKKIIYVSSVAAYGINPGTPLVIKEDTPCKGKEMPQFYYAHTKGLVEEFLDAFEAEHRDIIVTRFRPHIIAGPCFAGRTTNLDIILKPLASAKKRIFLTKPVNAPALMLQYTHEKDLVAAMIHAMHHDMPGAYNIAGDPVSTTELFASRGKSVVYLPFGLVDLAARAAARLLKRRRFDREWLQAVKYQVIVNCDKILGTGAIKNLAPTRAIIDQLLPLIS